ncbi:uncharacterized protein AMSG_05447 [Thecamonas trahens ATCC 50062]|uniref:Uncharacterized protein n=1 Tax=Thecamonas trahens ATCC 50062 TaxID=461836 RepID=A0A0L0DB25_THETB|nr:hypothetical protein AMSG_05447 [Thecamonas trahens ATCC 50062]KNC49440.1 hypothetical protein AMSG_05447 [Thecamonas trahens ATCC 50062]|eukprot:XP_013757862.1 hypothetical protein AMSG_05447 [Thecamonas trahens ATCC 50062]
MEGVQHIDLHTGNVMSMPGVATWGAPKESLHAAVDALLSAPDTVEVVASGPARVVLGRRHVPTTHISAPFSGIREVAVTLFLSDKASADQIEDAITAACASIPPPEPAESPDVRPMCASAESIAAAPRVARVALALPSPDIARLTELWPALAKAVADGLVGELAVVDVSAGDLATLCDTVTTPPTMVLISRDSGLYSPDLVDIAKARNITIAAHNMAPCAEMLSKLPLSSLCSLLAQRGVFSPSPLAPPVCPISSTAATDAKPAWVPTWLAMEQTLNVCRSLIASRSFVVSLDIPEICTRSLVSAPEPNPSQE